MTSPAKFYHVIQIILQMCSSDQSLVTVAFLWEKLSQPRFYKDLSKKTAFFKGWSWFRFNNLELALGTDLNFYTSVVKRLELKVRKFWGLIPTFVEVTGEKLVVGGGGGGVCPPYWIGLIAHKSTMFVYLTNLLWLIALFSKKYKFVEHNGS